MPAHSLDALVRGDVAHIAIGAGRRAASEHLLGHVDRDASPAQPVGALDTRLEGEAEEKAA